MKKAVSLLIMAALLACSAYAQSASEEKKFVLQGGIGFSSLGLFGTTQGLPLSLSFDYAISKEISIGIYLGRHSSRDVLLEAFPPFWEETGFEYGYTSIAARAVYHVDFFGSKKIDTYGVLSAGYCIVSASTFGLITTEEKTSFLTYGAGGGIRYFFAPNIGVFGEAGYGAGIDLLGIGISFKF